MHLKDDLMPRYAELIYNGFWFAPEREMLQALIDKSQEHVEGEVTLELYKGNVIVVGRESPKSLYSPTLVTFEDDKGAYDQKDAAGLHQAQRAAPAHARCPQQGRRKAVTHTRERLGQPGPITVPMSRNRAAIPVARAVSLFLSLFYAVYPAEHARART